MPLRDHQQDILFRGNVLGRALYRHRSEMKFLSRQIAFELRSVAANSKGPRSGAKRAWILRSQTLRRQLWVEAKGMEAARADLQNRSNARPAGPKPGP